MPIKKILLLILVLVCFSFSYEENYWPRSYFIRAGMGIGYTIGDLNEREISIKDSSGNKFKVYPPDMSILGEPELSVGVNIREFSLAVAFQYWKQKQELVKQSIEEDSRLWRLGFEFYYNFFWPDFFQIGLGAGFSYMSIKTEGSAFLENYRQSSEFMGSAIGLMANVQYYFNDCIAVIPAIKFYENWFKNLYTKDSSTRELSPYLWQGFILASISLQFQF